MHGKKSSFATGHLQHHSTIGAPEEHVTLGRSPFHIALVFASNGVLVIVVDLLLRLGLTPGIFVGWTVYLIAAEEMHWRIHMEGWLPWGLGFARAYHMSHHDTPNTRYNVFLPLFDFLVGNSRLPTRLKIEPLSQGRLHIHLHTNANVGKPETGYILTPRPSDAAVENLLFEVVGSYALFDYDRVVGTGLRQRQTGTVLGHPERVAKRVRKHNAETEAEEEGHSVRNPG